MTKVYGKLPEYLGTFEFQLSEVMYYLYLPVCMDNWDDIRLPENVQVCKKVILAAMDYADRQKKHYRYVYLSARKGWATADNPLNRPGWHCDGFGTDDLNFVWWDGAGTRFANQEFEGIVSDHNRSMTQFNEQVKISKIVTYPQHGLYCIDPSVVHDTPVITQPHMRQYVKVSMSDHPYNLENNSHNYLFDYSWPLHSRDEIRNDPHRSQRDYP